MKVVTLEDLENELISIEKRMDNFFGDEVNPHYGDRGYQDLCERRDEIQEKIEELQSNG